MKTYNERTKANSIEKFNEDVAIKKDLDLSLYWNRAVPAFQEMHHIGPDRGSLHVDLDDTLYVCMYVSKYVCMYYVCMYVCLYVSIYVYMDASALRPRMISH